MYYLLTDILLLKISLVSYNGDSETGTGGRVTRSNRSFGSFLSGFASDTTFRCAHVGFPLGAPVALLTSSKRARGAFPFAGRG